MAENTQQVQAKYLDLAGLQKLWQRISELYPRTSNLVTILDAIDDPYIHKSIYDTDLKKIEDKIAEVEAATGSAMDGDTIVFNDEISKFQTNLILDLDTEKQTIRLVTKDPTSSTEAPKAKTIISEIDYKPFVKDGMLDTVNLVVIPDDEEVTESRPAGTYLKFVFNTSAGKDAIYLNINEFTDIYEGSDYIIIQDNKILLDTIKLDAYFEEYISTKSVTINSIKTQIETITTDLNSVRTSVGDHEIRIGEIETNFTTIQTSFIELSEKVDTYDARITNIENVLETVPTEPISENDINDLE